MEASIDSIRSHTLYAEAAAQDAARDAGRRVEISERGLAEGKGCHSEQSRAHRQERLVGEVWEEAMKDVVGHRGVPHGLRGVLAS